MTISAAVLDAMVAAGCTAEQIAAVVKADLATNDERLEKKRANNADRQRRHRERNAVSRVTGVSNGDKGDETPSSSPVPLVPPSQTLPPIIPQTPSPSPETKRAKRLSADWVLPKAWGQWAVDQGHSEATIRLEADKFRDFWCSKAGKDASKLDWLMTWRNWMRNARSAPVGSQAPPGRQTIADVLKQQVLEMQEDERRSVEEGYGDGEADGFGPSVLRLANPSR